jgi:hypothetical protein
MLDNIYQQVKMMTRPLLIYSIFLLSCANKSVDNNDFLFIDKSTTIQEAIQFETKLKSEEIQVETRIYSSDTKPEDFDRKRQPIIFKRTVGLKIPIYVYYFFNPADSSVYETNYDWTNLYTEIENSKNDDTIQISTLPNYDQYKSEFDLLTDILDRKYEKHSIVKKYGETRKWVQGTTQMDLYLKGGQMKENLLRFTIKTK